MKIVQNITVLWALIKDFRMYVYNSCYFIPDNTIYKSVINSMQTVFFSDVDLIWLWYIDNLAIMMIEWLLFNTNFSSYSAMSWHSYQVFWMLIQLIMIHRWTHYHDDWLVLNATFSSISVISWRSYQIDVSFLLFLLLLQECLPALMLYWILKFCQSMEWIFYTGIKWDFSHWWILGTRNLFLACSSLPCELNYCQMSLQLHVLSCNVYVQ